ncbi:hypothetical protein QBC40DRAFT_337975 [Triangularia verruculosa]|uniref:BTB domain-containing protein n=1 Tax=Triangularia verruculosa TaxID=2587418 RepID=A0AAN7AXU9_9PEZI|nr:hypothetical protein QBC40DRAFT_337975 [Triangularia verruculosa]
MSDSLQVVVVASPFAGLASLYEVDPDADALVTVPPQTQQFAPWEETTAQSQTRETTSTKAAPPASRPGLRIKVSSKHLSFASKIFKSKLKYAGPKSKQSDGRIHLQLAPEEQFDSKAVVIVLNALHGKGSKVPKQVDLDTLAQIALFVDKFQLFDAVEVYGERWISRLEDTIPDAYNRDLILWLYISYVFRNAEVLRAATKTAIVGSDGPIKTLGLPIREKLIKHIDEQRQSLVLSAVEIVTSTLEKLVGGKAGCNKYHCDSFLLGELVKTLTKNKLVWPRPERPFAGISFLFVVNAVEGVFTSPSHSRGSAVCGDLWNVCNGVTSKPNGNAYVNGNGRGGRGPLTPEASPEPVLRNSGGYFDTHECDARKSVARLDELDALEDAVKGLDLEGALGYRNY